MPPINSIIGFLAIAAATPADLPARGEVKTFKDWSVGCDNGGACKAISLVPDNVGYDDWDGPISLVRAAGKDDILKIRVNIEANEVDRYRMMVDGRLVDTGTVSQGDYPIEIVGEDAKKVANAIAKGNRLQITGPKGENLTKISLAGSSAAMRYIDARQKRASTPTALIAKGRQTFRPLKAGIPLIPLHQWAEAKRIPATNEIVDLVESSKCKDERFGVVEDQVFPIGQKNGMYRALVLMSCGSGAYNFSSAAYIGEISGDESDGEKWTFKPASFDLPPSSSAEGGPPLLVNAYWDEADQILGSYAKGRGLGDCGQSERYVWDGERFRLIQADRMDECRGSLEWITTWRARYQKIRHTETASK